MSTLLITISLLLGINSCSNSTQQNIQVENVVSYEKMGTDTLVNFENETEGKLPLGFFADATNNARNIKWNVINDNGNKAAEQQSKNSGNSYNLLVLEKNGYKDFSASVKIKAISGEEDQGGGIIWHYTDKHNYYIARYNPLEKNLRLYHVVDGNREQLQSVDSDIKQGEWFTMTIEMKANKITCSLNGIKLIEASDDTFTSAGLIGLWTKADAITYFDDLKITTIK